MPVINLLLFCFTFILHSSFCKNGNETLYIFLCQQIHMLNFTGIGSLLCGQKGVSSLVPMYCIGRLLSPENSPTHIPNLSSGFAIECFWRDSSLWLALPSTLESRFWASLDHTAHSNFPADPGWPQPAQQILSSALGGEGPWTLYLRSWGWGCPSYLPFLYS